MLSQIKDDKSSFRNVTVTSIMVKKVCRTIAVTTVFCKGMAFLMKGQLVNGKAFIGFNGHGDCALKKQIYVD